jgi:hypothetical protein
MTSPGGRWEVVDDAVINHAAAESRGDAAACGTPPKCFAGLRDVREMRVRIP